MWWEWWGWVVLTFYSPHVLFNPKTWLFPFLVSMFKNIRKGTFQGLSPLSPLQSAFSWGRGTRNRMMLPLCGYFSHPLDVTHPFPEHPAGGTKRDFRERFQHRLLHGCCCRTEEKLCVPSTTADKSSPRS